MELKLISHTVCPTCSSCTVRESLSRYHVNGQGFEEREFKCGCSLSWSPNFNKLVVSRQCPDHPEEIEKEKKRKELFHRLVKLIEKADIDDSYRFHLMEYIQPKRYI